MLLFLLAHLVVAVLVVVVAPHLRSMAFGLAAAAPAATGVWAIANIVRSPVETPTAAFGWVPGLDLEFAFRLTPLAAMMTAAVGLIGLLVVLYASQYFSAGEDSIGRFLAALVAFAAAMTGLIWSDSVWTLFIFWEATSITSFLLVGHKTTKASARTSARRALMITGAGGLVLLAGLLLLVDAAGTSRLSAMPDVAGTSASIAAVLIVVGAATKSALVPFHVWLPGAMAAPTPVSAYLHSATMVKAGVFLIAVMTPVLGDLVTFRLPALVFGGVTIFWGGIGALRQHDAKLILAWGTVSQLGFLVFLLGIGSGKATFAAVAILAAHAVFKAGLFMVVGEIDIRTGTRDVRELSGLARSMPLAAAVALLCSLSMAGVPPLVGFAAKEAAVEAALGFSGRGAGAIVAVVVGGSMLTVAYTTYFMLSVFGGSGTPTVVSRLRPAMSLASGVLAGVSVLAFVLAGPVSGPLTDAAAQLNDDANKYGLIAWPGLTQAFIVSVLIVAVGVICGVVRSGRSLPTGAPRGAEAVDGMLDGLVKPARRVTAVFQHGSLPVYVATMATVLIAVSTAFAFAVIDGPVEFRVADNVGQALLSGLVLVAAFGATRVDSRLGAALALGIVGLAVTALFVAHGAPDLVLTQLLVETVVVVGFVVGLGALRQKFPDTGAQWARVRAVVSVGAALAVGVAMLAAGNAQVAVPPTAALVDQAVETGGGNNVVNVVLTDTRALDTLGEIVVLGVAALGVLALARRRPGAAETKNDPSIVAGGESLADTHAREKVPL